MHAFRIVLFLEFKSFGIWFDYLFDWLILFNSKVDAASVLIPPEIDQGSHLFDIFRIFFKTVMIVQLRKLTQGRISCSIILDAFKTILRRIELIFISIGSWNDLYESSLLVHCVWWQVRLLLLQRGRSVHLPVDLIYWWFFEADLVRGRLLLLLYLILDQHVRTLLIVLSLVESEIECIPYFAWSNLQRLLLFFILTLLREKLEVGAIGVEPNFIILGIWPLLAECWLLQVLLGATEEVVDARWVWYSVGFVGVWGGDLICIARSDFVQAVVEVELIVFRKR